MFLYGAVSVFSALCYVECVRVRVCVPVCVFVSVRVSVFRGEMQTKMQSLFCDLPVEQQ